MEKEFCTYDQALALKELGFDEPCFKKYIAGCLWSNPTVPEIYENIHPNSSDCLAPLYQQAFRWFRDKYNLVCIVFNDDGDIEHDNIRFNWEIRVITHSFKNMKNQKNASVGEYNYKTYEEAELECLKKLIEIVKNR